MANNIEIRIQTHGAPDSARAVDSVRHSLGELSQSAQQVGGSLSLWVTAPMLAVGGAAVKTAMDAVESENLFSVAMKGQADAARAWSEDLRKELGLNAYAVRQQVGTFQVMFTSMGIGEREALRMSQSLTMLSRDMASFYNISNEEAVQKLQAGITGEAEPLKRLGILVDENTVKLVAYRKGIAKVGEALTENQKVLAREAAIVAQTSDAHGDLARTIDSPANQLRMLKEEVTAASIELGQELIPLVVDLARELRPLVAGIGDAVDGFQELPGPVQDVTGVILLLGLTGGPVIRTLGGLASGAGELRKAMVLLRGASAAETLVETGVAAKGAATAVGTTKTAGLVGATTTLGGALMVGGVVLGGLALLSSALADVRDSASDAAQEVEDSLAKMKAGLADTDVPTLHARGAAVAGSLPEMHRELQGRFRSLERLGNGGKGTALYAQKLDEYNALRRTYDAAVAAGGAVGSELNSRNEIEGLVVKAKDPTRESSGTKKKQEKQTPLQLGLGGTTFASIGEDTLVLKLIEQAEQGRERLEHLRVELALTGETLARTDRGSEAFKRTNEQVAQLRNEVRGLVTELGAADSGIHAFTSARFAGVAGVDLTLAGAGAAPSRIVSQVPLDIRQSVTRSQAEQAARGVASGFRPANGAERNELELVVSRSTEAQQMYAAAMKGGTSELEQAGQIAVTALGSMAQAAIAGTGQMEQVVIQGFANIAQAALAQSNPILGAAIGVVGGIIGGLFGRKERRETQPVRIEEYSNRALTQSKKDGPDNIVLQILDASDGSLISQTEYQLGRNERRDAVTRLPTRR